MLNAADFHSRDRGFGFDYLFAIDRAWVLSRVSIEVLEMPKAYDKFYIETWVESAMKYFTRRNFRVVSLDGSTVYAYGRSIWAMINTKTRHPENILDVREGKIMDYIETNKLCDMEDVSRVIIKNDVEKVRTIGTYYSDLDINGHVNSVKYIEHILDLFPLSLYSDKKIKRLDIAYVAEAHCGDDLNFYVAKENEANLIKVTRNSGDEEVEVCRGRLIFV